MSANMNALRIKSRSAIALILVALLALDTAVNPVLSRRAVGRREVKEAVIGGRGEVGGSDGDGWADDVIDREQVPGRTNLHPGDTSPRDDSGASRSASVKVPTEPPKPNTRTKTKTDASGDVFLEGPVQHSVEERGLLLSRDVSASSIVQEHRAWHAEESLRRFDGEILGYVTPWNGRGYDFARTFRSKFTYISPVWYQLRGVPSAGGNGDGRTAFSLLGGHDFDGAWVSDVRGGGGNSRKGTWGGETDGVTKIVPRVVLEMSGRVQLSGGDLRTMADLLVEEALLRGYDGFVLDIPLADGIEEFIAQIKANGLEGGIDLLLIQSVRPGSHLSPRLLQRLLPLLHRFSLMTYDYRASGEADVSGQGTGVPNSPLSWVRECVRALAPDGMGREVRDMVLLGLPFYGYDNGQAMNYHDALSVLAGERAAAHDTEGDTEGSGVPPSVKWDPVSREHMISYQGRDMMEHLATYPTLAFIQERVTLAQELGVGLAVWELGQGMPYFFDLL